MASKTTILDIWQKLAKWSSGRWLFSRLVCFKAPYFSTIKPLFIELKPGLCRVAMQNRRAVHNHLGTVHAIAQCNLAELCAGVMMDATVPAQTHRWIPRGMEVSYLKKVNSDVVGSAAIAIPEQWQDKQDIIVPVEITDAAGECVFTAQVKMYVSAKRR